MTASVTVNTRKAERKFRLLEKAFDTGQLLQAVANDQLRWIDKNFRAGGLERKWRPLKPSTLFARRGGGGRALMDTGKLRMSFVRGRSENVYDTRPTSIIVGSSLEYAVFHEEGTKAFTIRPINKKALAFPHPAGPRTLKGMAIGRFSGKKGFVVRGVNHPGIPQRKILPTQRLGERMGGETIEKIIKATNRSADRG